MRPRQMAKRRRSARSPQPCGASRDLRTRICGLDCGALGTAGNNRTDGGLVELRFGVGLVMKGECPRLLSFM